MTKDEIYAIVLKHLQGQHNQKRHGWRYGSTRAAGRSMRGQPKGERDEYRKRAGLADISGQRKPPVKQKPEKDYPVAKDDAELSKFVKKRFSDVTGGSYKLDTPYKIDYTMGGQRYNFDAIAKSSSHTLYLRKAAMRRIIVGGNKVPVYTYFTVTKKNTIKDGGFDEITQQEYLCLLEREWSPYKLAMAALGSGLLVLCNRPNKDCSTKP